MEEQHEPVIITEPKDHKRPLGPTRAPKKDKASAPPAAPVAPPPSCPPKKRRLWPLAMVAVIIVGGLAGYGGAWLQGQMNGSSPTTILNTPANDGNSVVTASEESIAAVAKAVSPSIVSILTTSQQISRYYSQSYQQEGAGTGMIVTSDGYIMTNNHVIDGADTVAVVMPDGKTYENVQVIGSDPLNDVAFLKIKNVSDLPAVTLGDSKTIRIGQTVIAIGNALGQYQNTVTSGIISGTGRSVTASSGPAQRGNAENLTDLIQTDAAINSGNSGGPLLNLKGQVVGINTAVASDAQGIGFVIPVGATKGMLSNLIKTGKLERPYLGVQFVSINAQVKKEYDLPVAVGDYIPTDNGVQSGGPADKAGIKPGDIITKVNGSKVGEAGSVSTLVSEHMPGETVEVVVLRGGKEMAFKVTLGAYQR